MIVAAWGWRYLPPGVGERSWSRDMLASGCSGADNRRGLSKEKKAKIPIIILSGLLCGCTLASYNAPDEGAVRYNSIWKGYLIWSSGEVLRRVYSTVSGGSPRRNLSGRPAQIVCIYK